MKNKAIEEINNIKTQEEKINTLKELSEFKELLQDDELPLSCINVSTDYIDNIFNYKSFRFSKEKHDRLFKKIIDIMLKEVEDEIDKFIIITPEEQMKSENND